MLLLEYQAKELLARFAIPVPVGRITNNADDAERFARRLGFERFTVKAQVYAGDRSAGGGIRAAASPAGVRATTEQLLSQPLVTPQTGPEGERPRWVYIEQTIDSIQLLYAAIVLDRTRGELQLWTSAAGGAGIEARAAATPSLMIATPLQLGAGEAVGDFEGAAARTGLSGAVAERAAKLFAAMGRLAASLDATLVEINPLALSAAGDLVALDAKIDIDDNALIRQPALAALRAAVQVEQGDAQELAADRHQLNYQRMKGDIGVVVNGAGLALATLDLLIEAGGQPANFMDIRTTASSLDVAYGFELVLSNPQVKAVLVNVHGGGMQRCDTIAEGVGVAVRRAGRQLPMVVRLAGNNADFALVRLKSFGLSFEAMDDMAQAAQRAVMLARAGR
jgi:succinyl-CoA synthetase beta subunit